ncbi:hypothetical protein A7C99_0258 [Trichophyton rubrum]|uniref:Uncharacterized protein n=1 Tax=Trichophyton rubrum TaxID=5551 RepID=A0A178F7H5_TRIRU|nr:hypothetical protein A7C99_0258 [Trichophyton rubrum]
MSTINMIDPLGWHVTICYKDEVQASKGTHVASHGYVMGQFDLNFKKAAHAGEKVDTWEKRTGGIVWPPAEDLEEAPEIGYGHFPQDD